mmetsp:Transcript_28838/g.35336  ORF Transcript_28838/g.35336 Transcript_28838/m.35336 type:complete len:110 (+) Transcript_28838:3-332(+)
MDDSDGNDNNLSGIKKDSWTTKKEMHRMKRKKLRDALKNKKILDDELLTDEELKLKYYQEKLNPMDGDYDDGRTWTKRRKISELAYIQQLANEPDLEKEQESHDRKRIS